LWETYVTSRYVEAGVMRRVDEVRGDWPGFVIVAREEFARTHPGAMREALAVLDRAVSGLDLSAHTVELVMQNAGFREELAREWLAHVQWGGRKSAAWTTWWIPCGNCTWCQRDRGRTCCSSSYSLTQRITSRCPSASRTSTK
ncbi:MAG TPA: hypothetical protein PLN54_06990, partial [Flavobacteriales bacterium]|nr:hypothetical protein [Flavobacteriales bacterium]